ncbi:MAG: hypothetical protein ACLTMP_12330 [Eggerthella lenta]
MQVDAAVTIVHDCKVPLDRALETPELEDRGATEDAAFKLRRRIANMGTINPDAAEEYEQLKTRYDYLAAQLSDLDGARRSLAKIVRVIDARMKEDFIRTYEAVNRTSARYSPCSRRFGRARSWIPTIWRIRAWR